jgi:hypothetical protein
MPRQGQAARDDRSRDLVMAQLTCGALRGETATLRHILRWTSGKIGDRIYLNGYRFVCADAAALVG